MSPQPGPVSIVGPVGPPSFRSCSAGLDEAASAVWEPRLRSQARRRKCVPVLLMEISRAGGRCLPSSQVSSRAEGARVGLGHNYTCLLPVSEPTLSIWSQRSRPRGGYVSRAFSDHDKHVRERMFRKKDSPLFHGFTDYSPRSPGSMNGGQKLPTSAAWMQDGRWRWDLGKTPRQGCHPRNKRPRDLVLKFSLSDNATSWSPSVQNGRLWREFQYQNVAAA